jgi:dihydroorotate dehydrogenase electron transfer subunit
MEKAGEYLDIQGPLGNGYDLGKIATEIKAEGRSFDKAILFGGGIGVPPMLELARRLDCHKNVVVGYRNSQTFLKEDFEAVADTDVYIATEDGSVGTKGNVLDAVKQEKVEADVIFACGPTPMLRAIKAYALENDIPCYVSLEEKMACGIGACLACVCKSTEIDDHSQVKNKRVCKEGPVFNVKEVEL